MTCKIINHAIWVSIKLWDLKIINQYYLKFSLLAEEKEGSVPLFVHAIYVREGFMYKRKMEKAKKSVHCCVQNLNSPHISFTYLGSSRIFLLLKANKCGNSVCFNVDFLSVFRSRNIYSSCLWISWMFFLPSFLRSLYLLLKIASCLLNIIMQLSKQRRRKGNLSNHIFHGYGCVPA